jgi:Putative transposase, YhgA-like/Domain of unknown function (DUF4351)
VTEDLKGRADDLVWRLRMRGEPEAPESTGSPEAPTTKPTRGAKSKQVGDWLYVYLMLEFQSSNDPRMALRMMTYLGLLYQHLIKIGQVLDGDKLPSVFPLVLYNGQQTWTAATDIADLIEPGPDSLKAYRPHMKYFVLDEGRVPEDQLPENNLVTGIVRIERVTGPRELVEVLTPIKLVLELPQNREVKKAVGAWIQSLIIPRIEQLKKQALARGEVVEPDPPPTTLHTITELQDMLSEQLDSWERDVASKALLLGEQRGMLLGEQRGKLEGKLEGLLAGKFEAQSYTLRRLLSRRFGVLSPGVSAQIAAADISQIETWLDRVLDASSVADVLRNH